MRTTRLLRLRDEAGRAHPILTEERLCEFYGNQIAGERTIVTKLQNGELRATGFVRGAPPDAGSADINRELWRVLRPDFAMSSASAPSSAAAPGLVLDGILVFQRFDAPTARARVGPDQNPRGAGGRPPKFEWRLFDREMLRIANLDGLPNRAELQRRMLDFSHLTWGDDAPGDSTVRERIAGLYPD